MKNIYIKKVNELYRHKMQSTDKKKVCTVFTYYNLTRRFIGDNN